MRTKHALSLALAPLALGLLTVPTAGSASATPTQPAPSAVRLVATGGNDLPAGAYTLVSTGYTQTAGLTYDGRVLVGGYGATTVPASLASEDVVQLSAGYRHVLALDADGDVTAWGVLGDGTPPAAFVPQEVQDATVVQVAAGNRTDIALTDDGRVLTWGAPTQYEGFGAPPAEVADLEVKAVYAHYDSAAVLTTDGKVVEWGPGVRPAPAEIADETVVDLSVGLTNTLALTDDGRLLAWGAPSTGVNDIPAAVRDGDVVAFDMGYFGAMAATADGEVHAWGGFDRSIVPTTTGEPVADLQIDRYSATLAYATLANTAAPVVGGDAIVGRTLTANPGTWSTAPDAFHYRWTRDGEPVGTDAATYDLTAADADTDVAVTVTASAGDVTGTATTAAVRVARAQFTTAPRVSVSGVARVGRTLSMRVTDAAPKPDGYFYGWFRDGDFVEGADGPTYRLTSADLGHQVTAGVYAIREGYQALDAYSSPVRVAPGAATLRIGALARTKRGAALRVNAAGLGAGEVYTVSLDGKALLRSRADSAGRVTKSVRVPRAARTGNRTLVVVGSYADRTGRRTVSITR